MKFSIFDSVTGALLRTGECPAEDVALQARTGETLVSAYEAREGEMLVGDKVIERPPAPSTDHQWDVASRSWGAPLETVRGRRLAELKAERDRRVNGGFVWGSLRFDSNPISQSRLLGLYVDALNPPNEFPVNWRLADNTWRSISVADARALWPAFRAHMKGCFRTFATHEAAIKALTTVEQLQSYDLSVDWAISHD